ncbi:phage protease [Mycobacterium sp. 155]|uniref:phage protease n=1 Tax=Mycobacterium sp. 155 TaxID=1157943 RepID=UPI00036EB8E8|nr:phage protease [Mycobacterium sp. 155]
MALTFDDDQAAALLEALGLPADTADPQLVTDTAVDLAAQVETLDPAKPSTVAAAAKKAGLEVIDTATAEALRHDAAEGRRMAAAATQQRIEAAVDDAVRKGKITPARRKHWVTLITADPGMADVLASVPNETAAPMTEAGHSMNPDPGDNLADADVWVY